MNILNRKTFLGVVVSSLLINFTSQVNAEGVSNIVTVAKSGGDYTDPISAMNSIVDASADNPYLISIAPGTYTLASTLTVKPFVSITGSGQSITKLINQTTFTTLKLDQDMDSISIEDTLDKASTISNLTVENSLAGNSCNAIKVSNDGVGIRLKDLSVIASGCVLNSSIWLEQGMYYAKMDDVNVVAQGGTYWNIGIMSSENTALKMTSVDISAFGDIGWNVGMQVNSGTVDIFNSSIRIIDGSSIWASSGILFNNVNPLSAVGEKKSRIVDSIVDISRGESGDQISANALDMTNTSQIIVEGSTISSESTALHADSTSSITARSSTITGGIQGGGVKKCLYSTDGKYEELSATCL